MPTSNNVIQVIINGKNNALPAFRSATRMIAAFGAAAVAALTAATVRAGKFERGMAEIATLLDGDVSPAIETMRQEIMDLSVEFGQSIGKMTKARYDVISAGFTDAADSAIVLREASKLAVAGVSDVAGTADLLTTALNGMGASADQAAHFSDVLFQTVRKGKTTIQILANSMGKLFSTAKVAGVTIEELGAVMATLTAKGINTAEAVTSLNAVMIAIAAPAEEAAVALAKAGITMDEGLIAAFAQLASVSDKGLDALKRVIPSIEALKAASTAAGDIGLLNKNMKAMADAAGVTETAFKIMAETFDFKMDQMKTAMDALGITVGSFLLPSMTNLVEKAVETISIFTIVMQETENGKTIWGDYAEKLKDDVIPVLQNVKSVAGFVIKAVKGMSDAIDTAISTIKANDELKEFNTQVTEVMKSLLALEDNPFGPDRLGNYDLVRLREYAEIIVLARKNAESTGADTIVGDLVDDGLTFESVWARINKALDDARKKTQAAKGALLPTGIPLPVPHGKVKGDVIVPTEANEELEGLKEQIASLAEFTIEDFADMAFAVGDSFAMVATEVGAHMLGLTKGPLMLGRAFASMAASILSDIARIIARLLVAKALMSFLDPSGFFGKVAGGLTKMASGGTIPRAASGMSVPSSMGMVVPGSPGLDRSLVMAHGGEVMVPRQTVDGIDRSRKRARLAPPPARRNKGRGAPLAANFQAYRPFRREEQNLLVDSVTESEGRAERHRG